jgi:hypothetical protein
MWQASREEGEDPASIRMTASKEVPVRPRVRQLSGSQHGSLAGWREVGSYENALENRHDKPLRRMTSIEASFGAAR